MRGLLRRGTTKSRENSVVHVTQKRSLESAAAAFIEKGVVREKGEHPKATLKTLPIGDTDTGM
jgi:hypothetical protein